MLRRITPKSRPIEDPKYKRKFLDHLHSRITLHEKQLAIASHLLAGKNVVVSCGRKFGKSTAVQYTALRKAVMNERCYVYVILPTKKQAEEIYWEQSIIEELCHADYIKRISQGQMRYSFTNGSFVKFDGSDSTEVSRGPTAHMVLFDEIKDIKAKAFTSMEPNLLATGGNWGALGTPPREEAHESEQAKFWFHMVYRGEHEPGCKMFYGDSEENPFIDRLKLLQTENQLRQAGRYDEYLREYKGQFARSTNEMIFSDFVDERHVFSHERALRLAGL